MARTIKFRTKVLSQSDKQQIYAYFDKHKQCKTHIKKSIFGGTYGELHFWR